MSATDSTNDDFRNRAESIIRGMTPREAFAFIRRVETGPMLLAMYEHAIFEHFIPVGADLREVDISSAAAAAAKHTLARLEKNDLTRAELEADAIDSLVKALPLAHLFDIPEEELAAMRVRADEDISHLANIAGHDGNTANSLVSAKSSDLNDVIRDISFAHRILDATEEILGANIHRAIIETYEAEQANRPETPAPTVSSAALSNTLEHINKQGGPTLH